MRVKQHFLTFSQRKGRFRCSKQSRDTRYSRLDKEVLSIGLFPTGMNGWTARHHCGRNVLSYCGNRSVFHERSFQHDIGLSLCGMQTPWDSGQILYPKPRVPSYCACIRAASPWPMFHISCPGLRYLLVTDQPSLSRTNTCCSSALLLRGTTLPV